MYEILWIDDQYKDSGMIQFIIEAENEGLILHGYTSFEEGFEALERNIDFYDVILLDGLFFEKKGQEAGTEDELGIGMAIAKINELKSRKYFPWFVLSGKDKFTKVENSLLKANNVRCFDKTNRNDIIELFKVIKTAAADQPDIQLKHKYSQLLETSSNELLGEEQYARLFSLIKDIENPAKLSYTEDLLNPIRKIIERMFIRLAEIGIIPDDIISNRGWINGSSLFLANKHLDYEQLEEIAPKVISENIHRLLNIIQDASHGDGDLKLRVDQYLRSTQTDYLYRSCVYLLFDILIWFKDLVYSNKDVEVNKSRWKRKENTEEWISGTIIRIVGNGFGVFQPDNDTDTIGIHPDMVKIYELNKGEEIKVTTKPSPCGSKTYIKEISKEI